MAYTKRLRVDPSISVMDLQRVLLRQIDRSKEKGLFDCLKHPMNAPWSWKTAPCTAWLSTSADLLVDFLKIAPNGVLPSAKMRLALQRLLLEPKKKINTTAYDNDKFMDEADARIRVLLSQARQLKKSGQSYDTAMRKATMEDKELVDLILGHLKLGLWTILLQSLKMMLMVQLWLFGSRQSLPVPQRQKQKQSQNCLLAMFSRGF